MFNAEGKNIKIDAKQIESCGSIVFFVENGLKPDVEFDTSDIHVSGDADGLGNLMMLTKN